MSLKLQARAALQPGARNADIVIMSYETLRGDAAWATSQPWLYAVLDEGHTIRNTKSKIAQARVTQPDVTNSSFNPFVSRPGCMPF